MILKIFPAFSQKFMSTRHVESIQIERKNKNKKIFLLTFIDTLLLFFEDSKESIQKTFKPESQMPCKVQEKGKFKLIFLDFFLFEKNEKKNFLALFKLQTPFPKKINAKRVDRLQVIGKERFRTHFFGCFRK